MKSSLNIKWVAPILLIVALAVGLSAHLNDGKFAHTFTDLESSRFAVLLNALTGPVEGSLDLGLSLDNLEGVHTALESVAAQDPLIESLVIFEASGRITSGTGIDGRDHVPASWLAAMARTPKGLWQIDSARYLDAGLSLANNLGEVVGGVAIRYDWSAQRATLDQVTHRLTMVAAEIVAGSILALLVVAGLFFRVGRSRQWPLLGVLAIVALSQLVMAFYADRILKEDMAPSLQRKADVIAHSTQRRINHALDVGVPFDALVGVEELFADIMESAGSVRFVALTDPKGRVVSVHGIDAATLDTLNRIDDSLSSAPILHQGQILGAVHVGLDPDFVGGQINEVRIDLATLLVVSLLIGFAVLTFSRAGRLTERESASLIGICGDGCDARMPVFLFVFAEQLTWPFMPLLAGGLAPSVHNISTGIAAAMPIVSFMGAAVIGLLVAPQLSGRGDLRRTFAVGALITVFGLIGGGFAPDLWWLLGARALSGFGSALMFGACEHTHQAVQKNGKAVLLGAMVLALACGPGLGGLLADQLGFDWIFTAAALVACLSAIVAYSALPANGHGSSLPLAREWRNAAAPMLKSARFWVMTLFAGIPVGVVLGGFLLYLVPVYLATQDFGISGSGRIISICGVSAVLLMPLFSRLADRMRCHGALVGAGLILSGAGLLPVLFVTGSEAVIAAVIILGIGQAMVLSSLPFFVAEVCAGINADGSTAGVRLFRLCAGLGAVLGAVVAAFLSIPFGVVDAIALIGAALFIAGVVFSTAFLIMGIRPEQSGFEDIVVDSEEEPA